MPCTSDRTPGPLQKAKFIKNFVMQRCYTPWSVVLRTGGQADLKLVLGLINTSPEDFVRFLLRPKGARTQRHGISSMLTNEAAAEDEAIPDTAKLAADTTRLVFDWKAPTYTDGLLHIWELENLLERAAYYFLVVSVVEDFAYDWYSGILLAKESKCSIGRWTANQFSLYDNSEGWATADNLIFTDDPAGAHYQDDAVAIDQGLWVIKASLYGDSTLPAGWASKCHWRMRLGSRDGPICGETRSWNQPQNVVTGPFVWQRLITGPDVLHPEFRVEATTHPFTTVSLHVDYQCFRID